MMSIKKTTTPPSAKVKNTQDQPGVEMLPWETARENKKMTTPDSCELLQKPTGMTINDARKDVTK